MRGKLIQEPTGGLSIWRMPAPDVQYAIGVDTSAGIRGGDYSVAEVIEMKSCEQVAEWHGWFDPTRWGFMVSRLGWYYNAAPLAIETHPSPHGLTAYESAARYGYTNLWRQEKWDAFEHKFVTRKGWVRTPHSTLHMLDRVRQAISEGNKIRSRRLLTELGAMRMEGDKPVSSRHDDCVMAYAVALKVRDDAYVRGVVAEEKTEPADAAAAYWQAKGGSATTEYVEPMFDGS